MRFLHSNAIQTSSFQEYMRLAVLLGPRASWYWVVPSRIGYLSGRNAQSWPLLFGLVRGRALQAPKQLEALVAEELSSTSSNRRKRVVEGTKKGVITDREPMPSLGTPNSSTGSAHTCNW